MTEISRRNALKVLASAPLAAGFGWTEAEAQQAHKHVQEARRAAAGQDVAFVPKFFTPHEYETVQILVDRIIPRDERSGSATDAGVPEFMDFILTDDELYTSTPVAARQTAMRGGLAWLDLECQKRFNKTFVDCSEAERVQVLDDISRPAATRREFSHGVSFFNSFRDLTATGFWTSKIGVEDLQYLGNVFVAEWTGCPDEALKKLDVKYKS